MKKISILFLLPVLFLAGCTTTTPKDFNIVFTMESIRSYKQTIEIGSDKSYSIRQRDMYFDSYAQKSQINTAQGKLTDEEYAELTKLVADSRIFNMKDVYGFQKTDSTTAAPFEGIMYQLKYTEGNKTKTILIRPNKDNTYPGKFPQLLQFLGAYLSEHLQKN